MSYKVVYKPRELIEKKLLNALTDEGAAAMLGSEQDLKDLRDALRIALKSTTNKVQRARWKNLLEGIVLLIEEAF